MALTQERSGQEANSSNLYNLESISETVNGLLRSPHTYDIVITVSSHHQPDSFKTLHATRAAKKTVSNVKSTPFIASIIFVWSCSGRLQLDHVARFVTSRHSISDCPYYPFSCGFSKTYPKPP